MHKFGYIPDALDFRDFNYGAVVDTTRKLPKAVDLTNLMPPVYHQGNSSSCVAQAVAAAMYYNFVKNNVTPEALSRLFIYYNTRAMENSIDLDQGCQIRNAIKSVANIGAPNEKLWPFIPVRYKDKPVQKAYDHAKTNLVSSYSRVNQNLYELKYCLASGYPVVFGIAVYTSFTFSTVEKTGIVYLPKKGEKLLGGHAIVLTGYNDDTKRFTFRNSYGTSWGNKGYGTISYDYVTSQNLADDFWVIKNVL